jgi:hypothetical protein
MKNFSLFGILNQVALHLTVSFLILGCRHSIEEFPDAPEPISGIYLERFFSGDNGWPESDLYLGCRPGVFDSVKILIGFHKEHTVKLIVPCEQLSRIDDSMSTKDSLAEFGHYPQVWVYYRLAIRDSGFSQNQKLFSYADGKRHIHWILDYLHHNSPAALKSVYFGERSYPFRDSRPDSAWLDTLKKGFF